MLKTVNIHEAKTKLSQLITLVENEGKPITLCRNGKPVAQLEPYRATEPKRTKLVIKEELKPYFCAGFDPAEPVSEDEWPKEAQ